MTFESSANTLGFYPDFIGVQKRRKPSLKKKESAYSTGFSFMDRDWVNSPSPKVTVEVITRPKRGLLLPH